MGERWFGGGKVEVEWWFYMELQPLELSLQALIQSDASPTLPHHGDPAAEAFQGLKGGEIIILRCPDHQCSTSLEPLLPFGTQVPALDVELGENSFITDSSRMNICLFYEWGFSRTFSSVLLAVISPEISLIPF